MISSADRLLNSVAAPSQSGNGEKEKPEPLRPSVAPPSELEVVRRLTKGIAHEFNNLLAVILGFDELILKTTESRDPLHTCALKIKTAADCGASLTRQLAAFCGLRTPKREIFNLHESLREMENRLSEKSCATIEVRVQCLCDPASTWIEADPAQIADVIFDLAQNACDAMPRGGLLLIYTATITLGETEEKPLDMDCGEYVLLGIHDTGCGMNAETLSHVFEPFFTTKPVGCGTGLALAACYGIVRENGGHIRVATGVGRGTTFEIMFPKISPIAQRK